MKKTASDKRALSVAEMAETLGISRTTAYELVNREDFPSMRIGQRIIVPERGVADAANV